MAGRHRLVALALVALALVVLLSACGWTQYAGDAGRTGSAPLEQALTTANIGSAGVRWTSSQGTGATAIADGMIIATSPGSVQAWPAVKSQSCPVTPPSCAPAWYAHFSDGATSEPAILGDTVYVAAIGVSANHLYAFPARGGDDCSTPSGCHPKWVGTWGAGSGPNGTWAPTIVASEGRVYVHVVGPNLYPSTVTAFDAAGTTNCSGTPTICSPLFRTSDFSGNPNIHATVAGERLYVPTATSVAVFDATGSARCSAGVCAALYLLGASPPAEVAVADGQAFFANGSNLWAFDATGHAGCDTAPTPFCLPLWHGHLLGSAGTEAPVIAGTHVYASSITSPGAGAIQAFDRTPAPDCTGSQLECPARFRTASGWTFDRATVVSDANLLLVASTSLPFQQSTSSPRVSFELSTFDLNGVAGCSGAPKVCTPLSTLPLGSDPNGADQLTRPALGAGVVVVPHQSGAFQVVGLP